MTDENHLTLRDAQGATVWQRLDACDRASLDIAKRLVELSQEFAELRNELSVVTSIQRVNIDLDNRMLALEKRIDALAANAANGSVESPPLQRFPPFGSTGALVEAVENLFDCKNGDYRAFHRAGVEDEKAIGYRDYPYSTLGLIAPASIPGAQERLRQALYAAFVKLRDTCKAERPVLYWRYGKEIRIQEDETEETHTLSGLRYKVSTRIAIPEADFSVIGDIVHVEGAIFALLKG